MGQSRFLPAAAAATALIIVATTVIVAMAWTQPATWSAVALSPQRPEPMPAARPVGEHAAQQAAMSEVAREPSPPRADAPPAIKIEPNTPREYLSSYLSGYTPAEIQADGTQIYHNIPFHVRQPDGTYREQMSTVKVKPVPAVPRLEDAKEIGPRGH